MFAFLGARRDFARIDIEIYFAPARFENPSRGWATISGTEMPFCIVTRPDELRGVRLIGYRFLPSAIWMAKSRKVELELIAQSRLVNQPA